MLPTSQGNRSVRFLGLDSPFKITLFVFYVFMWALQGILVHRANKNVKFESSSIVLIQELFKLIISVSLFRLNDGPISSFIRQVSGNLNLCMWYFVPAVLYAIYNNLTFLGLSLFDPATYFVLMQFRIVLTGLISIMLLGKIISKDQWIGLVVVMIGAMFKEIPRLLTSGKASGFSGYFIVFIQLTLSALAGVFNEKLLKGRSDCSLNVQNFFMYFDSIIINWIWSLGVPTEASDADQVTSPLTNPYLLPVIVNASFLGVLTAFFLKHLSSVLKSIASAVELWVTTVLSAMVFGYAIDLTTVGGIAILTVGVNIYSVASTGPPAHPPRLKSVDGSELEPLD